MIQRLTPLNSPIQVGANDEIIIISSIIEGYVIVSCAHCGNVRSTYPLALFIPGKTENLFHLQREVLKELPRCLCKREAVK